MDNQIDSSGDGSGIRNFDPRRSVPSDGVALPNWGGGALSTGESVEAQSTRGRDPVTILVTVADDTAAAVSPVLRWGSLALIVFQLGYLLLDRAQYPLTFARTSPLHAASIALSMLGFGLTLSPRAMRNWRGMVLTIDLAIFASTARIAEINANSDVLVASILLFFFSSGVLFPWSPRWQAAFATGGMLAFLGYSMQAANLNPHVAIDWSMVLTAAMLSQLSVIHSARYRRNLAEHLCALAEKHRLLRREMDLRAIDATARERVYDRLQESESMLRKVFEASPDNIAVNSLTDGRFIAVNDHYQIVGYTRDDVMGANLIALGMWPHAEELNWFLETVRQTGHVRNMEMTQRGKDGTLETHLISASKLDVDGEPCVVSMTRDITEIKRVETNLRASHAAMRKIFEATLDIIVVTRMSDSRDIDFNQQFERLGYGQQDLDDSRTGKRRMWASEEKHSEFRKRIQADGVVRNMEVDFILPDTGLMPALVSAVQVELEGEACVVTMIRDQTQTKAASRELEQSVKALRDSEETFRKLFDANLDSMTLGSLDGTYIDVNEEFVRGTGYSREEAIGHRFQDLNLWIHPDEMLAFASQLMKTNEVRNLEVAIRHKDGSERPVLLSAVNLELHGQICCLTISREISDIKMTQRELVAAREAALAASRAKSEFLSSMSHEIRTPMNSILGMADLLTETTLDDEQRRYLSTVISNGHALLELINSILDLAKVESGRINLEAVEFNLKDVTEKVLETLAIRAHEKGLELMVRFAPEVPDLVLGDSLRLGQILINLVGNAIKFTPHGQVLLSIEREAKSTAECELKFTVTDTGVGIAADKLHLLFDAFSQADSSTSRKYGGSGLGLAIVARLVALMHGAVAVESEPGTGSAFSFTAQFGTASIQAPPDIAFGDIGIVLVDDNADSSSIVSQLLRTQGAQVTQTSSGVEAMLELGRDRPSGPRFQILVLNGLVQGLAIAERLMHGGPGRPQIVMMLATNDLSHEVGRLRAIGVDNYIVKPVRRAELFAAVERARERMRLEPRDDGTAPTAPASSSPSSVIVDRPAQILMVDDSPDNRALIRAYFKKTSYLLEEADDGQKAIDKFIAGKFDVVLMDIQMPIVDGYEATAKIREWERTNNRRRTPIVALTAAALEEAMHRSKAAGCDAHVTKPVKKSTLLAAIRDLVESNPVNDKPLNINHPQEETCRTE